MRITQDGKVLFDDEFDGSNGSAAPLGPVQTKSSENRRWRMSAPRVSVTMTVRNVERFLAESIESVLGQTFTDFEFIIVDFGSTDNSKEIIRAYSEKDRRIKFYETPDLTLVRSA